MKKFAAAVSILISFVSIYIVYENVIKDTFVYDIKDFETASEDIDLKAGKTMQFRFHSSYGEDVSVCELKVPKNYSKDKPSPIFVWFAPGKGSYSVQKVPPFVDFDEYFVLALPYFKNQLPRLAIQGGFIDDFWDYNKPMFDYVIHNIPNLSKNKRIAAGFSSGAHYVGSGLDRNWDGFTNFFTRYVIHEGGGAPDMTYKGIKPSDKILLTYGDSSNGYGKVVEEFITRDHKNVTVYAVPNTGHEITPQTLEYIRGWIDYTF